MQVNGKEDPGAKTGKPSRRKDCTGTMFPLLYDEYLLWFQRTTFLKVQDGCQDLRIGYSMFTSGATNIMALEGIEFQDVCAALEKHSNRYGVPG